MIKRRFVVAGLAVALTGGACGSNAATKAPHGSSALALTAYQATNKAGTAKFSIQAQVTGAPGGATTPGTSGTGVIRFSPSAAELDAGVPNGGTLVIRVLGQILYLMPPTPAGQAPSPKPWIEINLNQAAQSGAGSGFSSLSPSGSVNPANVLGYLQGVSHLSKVGPESIKGVPATHYKGTVDLNKLAAMLSGKAQTAYRKIVTMLHTSTVPIDLWVDAQGRAVQVRTQVPVPAPTTTTAAPAKGATTAPPTTAPANGGILTTTVDYYDFGAPVTVAAPPASQVTQYSASSTG